MITPYAGYVEVAEALNALTPGDHDKRTALFNSGAEAVENAVKIARLATGRSAVAAFDHAYHGRTNLTMALTAKAHAVQAAGSGRSRRRSTGRRCRTRSTTDSSGEAAAARAISVLDKQVGADAAGRGDHRADPGRGRVHRARARIPRRRCAEWCREHGDRVHRGRGAERVRPHRRDVRLRARGHRPGPGRPPRRASPAGCRWPASPAARRS